MLEFSDGRRDPDLWVKALGVSREAAELHATSDVIDLHLDSFIWHRIFGYDLAKRHGRGVLGARFLSQCDFPRVLEAGLTGATWIITTNPVRTARGRAKAFVRNVGRLRELFAAASEHFAVVRNAREYRAARAQGKHGAFLGIQGGNALDESLDSLDLLMLVTGIEKRYGHKIPQKKLNRDTMGTVGGFADFAFAELSSAGKST